MLTDANRTRVLSLIMFLSCILQTSLGFSSRVLSKKHQYRSVIGRIGRVTSLRDTSDGIQQDALASHPLKVAYQGEPGAYSEKAARELLGPRILTVASKSFEDAFKAVARKEVDYACIPIENSLGGSIHQAFDLLLRYNLYIIGEHEFRVEHTLLALPGVKKEDIKTAMSHPQALAQCDNYLRAMGITPESAYDTAGSAKIIKEKNLRNCAAIASDLAGKTYGLDVLERNIEDDDNNFTRFLLLSRLPVSSLLPPKMASKTSILFVLPNNPGALYKALACFSLRDIDMSKIESRPTSVSLLQKMKILALSEPSPDGSASTSPSNGENPRFRYTFYLDFLASEFEDRSQNALLHLKEQSEYVRVLGSYPKGGQLIGPIKATLRTLDSIPTQYLPMGAIGAKGEGAGSKIDVEAAASAAARALAPPKPTIADPLKIGIIGFGNFGQFLAKTFVKQGHTVYAVNKRDVSPEAKDIGCAGFFHLYDIASFAKTECDVVILAVSIISLEEVLTGLPVEILSNSLVVDVLSVKAHPKSVMLRHVPESSDILCTHPMFGPESGKYGWQALPFLFDKIRIKDASRCERFLKIWEAERCKMIEMTCEQHDEFAANSQFITHLTGRILWEQNLVPTPIDTKGFQTVLNLVENTSKDSFDLFFGLYFYNSYASDQLKSIREALANVERQLAAKEAYLAARAEVSSDQRNRILNEVRALMKEAMKDK